jgi:two-component system, OmpR family, sensor histidine kinase CreC
MSTIAPFVERAERKILWSGFLLLGLSLAVGAWVTWWVVSAVRQLRRYAGQVAAQATDNTASRAPGWQPVPPRLPGELGELAQAMELMRQRLEGREHLESQVRALTHELKSPLAAIRGANELLQDDLSPTDRQRFVRQVDQQSLRLQNLVEQMLELTQLESLHSLPAPQRVDLRDITAKVLEQHAAALEQRGLRVQGLEPFSLELHGDANQLALAISNVLGNAITHAPQGSSLELALYRLASGELRWSLRDSGLGVPAFALPQLGQRFFSTAAPAPDGKLARGSGLGLAIVKQVLWLHRGKLIFENAEPGLRVIFILPAA